MGYSQIKGVVFDKNGITLPGVSISIKGTTRGTTTNTDGFYEIDATTNDILIFQFVGFLTQKVEIKNKSEINIYLAPDIVNLDEVVVLGYSNKARNEIASAVSVVEADELMDPVLLHKSGFGASQPSNPETMSLCMLLMELSVANSTPMMWKTLPF